MTAEVAILNKTAVALAADSAVTISAGSDQQKIYDSADKLFELSCHDPIGIMVNGDMNFAQAPLPVLVKMFRESCARFKNCEDASESFLRFLADIGSGSPEVVKKDDVDRALRRPFETIKARAERLFIQRITVPPREGEESRSPDYFLQIRERSLTEQFQVMKGLLERQADAVFLNTSGVDDADLVQTSVKEIINAIFEDLTDEQLDLANDVANLILVKPIGPSNTGIVVAGFGYEEIFPTLMFVEVFGLIGNNLKYVRKEAVDIDPQGVKARVLPFAQKEMVERFLYGLDASIRKNISDFCEGALPRIRERILDGLEMSDEDLVAVSEEAKAAEKAFIDGLVEESFEAIRKDSESEIEGMVEFMPKPELARMAEALVDLTSIKRRVTKGHETVGGPIDVAIISKAEGFVWVKRKHYFPPELNPRFLARRLPGAATGGVTNA